MNIRNIFLGICLVAAAAAYAHDFTATVNGQRLCFEITNKTKKTAAITYNGSIADKKTPDVNGIVEIPSRIKHNNVIYEVTAIGPKAFANARQLKGIIIPSGVTSVGDFAFENCDSLESIVFPGNEMKFGQGVFFNCTSIAGITLGSDWKEVNLTMFRWSKALESINIPAKVEKIQGIKRLKMLRSVSVDANNRKFSSADGMLYNNDGTILYACPRAFAGKAVIKEGTQKITEGALIDCPAITAIDFPSSLQSVSFRETSRMNNLSEIIMRPSEPVITAYDKAGEGKFLFQIVDPKIKIVILSSSKKAYEAALATAAGEYSLSKNGVPYEVAANEMPGKKCFKTVKNFDKY